MSSEIETRTELAIGDPMKFTKAIMQALRGRDILALPYKPCNFISRRIPIVSSTIYSNTFSCSFAAVSSAFHL